MFIGSNGSSDSLRYSEIKNERAHMKRRIVALLAGLAVAVIAVLFVPGVASAHEVIIGGQICKSEDHGGYAQDKNGGWHQCVKEGKLWKWTAATVTPPASKSASPSASTSSGTSGNLPVTGVKEDVIAGVGALAVVGGGVTLWAGRRRRNKVQFTA
jgi:LPXTG-motif cell wall-anchored protein